MKLRRGPRGVHSDQQLVDAVEQSVYRGRVPQGLGAIGLEWHKDEQAEGAAADRMWGTDIISTVLSTGLRP